MAMRRDGESQPDLIVSWSDVPRSPGHAFYDKLQKLLVDAGFDRFVEDSCQAYYAPRMGAPSVPPGRYFRMLLIGYFEGIHSERGIVWRCSDSLSLREFLRLSTREKVPDHSWLSKTRSRLPHELHDKIFGWVLALVAGHDLVKAERIGVDGSTMEANAALRTILRRDNGETYREMLTRMAKESGIDTPTADDLVRLDRKRKGKKLSNADWESATDPDAKIARMKNGSTRLAYKPEHAVDLDTGVIVAAPIHSADQGDTNTLDPTLKAAARHLAGIGLTPTSEDRCDLVADKGVTPATFSSASMATSGSRGYPSRQHPMAICAGMATRPHRRPFTPTGPACLKSAVGRKAMRKRGEMVERSFAHVLDRGGMRRAWLRGRENLHKRYLIHVAGFNLGVLMRALFGCGTPREAAGASQAFLFVVQTQSALLLAFVAAAAGETGALLMGIAFEVH